MKNQLRNGLWLGLFLGVGNPWIWAQAPGVPSLQARPKAKAELAAEARLEEAQRRVQRLEVSRAVLQAKLSGADPETSQAFTQALAREAAILVFSKRQVAHLRQKVQALRLGLSPSESKSKGRDPEDPTLPPKPSSLGPLAQGLWDAAARGNSRPMQALVQALSQGSRGFALRPDLACSWTLRARKLGFAWARGPRDPGCPPEASPVSP